jgi:hypothetical protein
MPGGDAVRAFPGIDEIGVGQRVQTCPGRGLGDLLGKCCGHHFLVVGQIAAISGQVFVGQCLFGMRDRALLQFVVGQPQPAERDLHLLPLRTVRFVGGSVGGKVVLFGPRRQQPAVETGAQAAADPQPRSRPEHEQPVRSESLTGRRGELVQQREDPES